MKYLLVAIFLIVVSHTCLAQDFPYGTYKMDEVDMGRYAKDTGAHAVVLKEFGKAYISNADHTPLIFEYHVKIKIIDDKGFKNGDVAIHIYKSDDERYEKVSDIEGITYYKNENGSLQKAVLDSKKVFHENVNKHHEYVKFAMPNLRPGCVIEYKYRVESPYVFNFHKWEFQSDIPKIYTEYEAHIPAVYNYNVVLRGYLKLTKNIADLEHECFTVGGIKADCSKITYMMADVPAFVEEDNMTAASNFISAVYFELSDYTSYNGGKIKVTKEWKDIDYDLKKDESFGDQMRKKDFMKDRVPAISAINADTLAKARQIYAYLQKWFKWNRFRSIYSEDGLKKAWDAHSGNVADINISLIAALSAAGIKTEAVLLSTRDNGIINKLYPVVTDFDYVVAKTTINNKSYLLDATDPLLAFGMLPIRCINDQGRVVSLDKPSYWIDMVTPYKRTITSALDLTLQPDGKMKGIISTYSIGYAAYEKRVAIKKFNTVEEYVENLDEKLTKLKILKSEITGVDSLNSSISEKYEVEINAYNSLDRESFSFNPAFWDHISGNPFKLTERNFPVDMGSASDHKMIVTLHYPDNFMIANQPAPVGIALPNKGGAFITSMEGDNNMCTYSQVEQFNKSVYSPQEYPYLKELYNKIIQNQKADIVFRKKP